MQQCVFFDNYQVLSLIKSPPPSFQKRFDGRPYIIGRYRCAVSFERGSLVIH
jgi:hypothetical protein